MFLCGFEVPWNISETTPELPHQNNTGCKPGPASFLLPTRTSQSWKSEISVLREGIEEKCESFPSCAAYTEGWMSKWAEKVLLQKQLSFS